MSYKSDETLLLKYLGASPTLRIVDFFLDNPLSDYSKNEIVNNLAMSRVTFFKYWKELEKSGAVKPTRRGSKLEVVDTNEGILFRPKLSLYDAAGSASREASVADMKKLLDRLRNEDA